MSALEVWMVDTGGLAAENKYSAAAAAAATIIKVPSPSAAVGRDTVLKVKRKQPF